MSFVRSFSLFLLLVVPTPLFAGCGGTSPRAALPASGDETLGIPLALLLQHLDARAADGRLPVLDRLNPPIRMETATFENRHVPGQVDTVKTYYYDGLTLELYTTGTGKEIVLSLVVTSPAYSTSEGLAVGTTRAELRQIQGPPDREENQALIYALDLAGSTFEVSFADGRATTLAWYYYVD